MFLHVVDVSDKHFRKHIKSVEKVLEEMELLDKERLIVFNKIDKLTEEELEEKAGVTPAQKPQTTQKRSATAERFPSLPLTLLAGTT